jgi:hypothetical protein
VVIVTLLETKTKRRKAASVRFGGTMLLTLAIALTVVALTAAAASAGPAGPDQCHKAVPQIIPKRDGTPCDDGDACTTNDTCTYGACGGTVLPGCRLDLQSCYAAQGRQPKAQDVVLDDGSGPRTFRLRRAARVCAPAATTGALHDALSHLTCSRLAVPRGASFAQRTVQAHDRFGDHTFSITTPRELCAPSWPHGAAQTTQLDDYACYPVQGARLDQQLSLTDERGTASVTVLRPTELCVPVVVDSSHVRDSRVLLTCYAAASHGPSPAPTSLDLENAFGRTSLTINKRQLVCVPTTVDSCAQLSFTTVPGSASCGGQSFDPPPSPPFAGALFDAATGGVKIADLGGACSYFGGGDSEYFPAAQPSTGNTLSFDATSCSGDVFALVAKSGGDAASCIGGPSTDVKICLNDTTRTCSVDADCPLVGPYASSYAFSGRCAQAPRCFSGTPYPFYSSLANACVVPISSASATGSVRPAAGEVAYSLGTNNAVYIDLNDFFAANPCPRCLNGTCVGGARDGRSCTPTASPNQTSTDCLPRDQDFFTFVPGGILSFSTTPHTMSASNGLFCPSQANPGAFGEEDVRRIELDGTPAGSLLDFAAHAATFLSLGCAPASGDPLVDSLADLPGPAAASVTGLLQMQP